MAVLGDSQQIPLFWINLNRAAQRRARMEWAIQQGGWTAHRLEAVDARDRRQRLLALPNLLKAGVALPGLIRSQEAEPWRRTSRAELACLASWKRLLVAATRISSPSSWLLLMEDDLGASLAAPKTWAHTLLELIEHCPSQTLAIQLAPISAGARQQLAGLWHQSKGRCLSVAKETIRSHGNGAVLLHQRALPLLIDPLLAFSARHLPHCHPLLHPWRIRPVADKWLYGALPPGSCQVATYPHFCLEAGDSFLHQDHVQDFHLPSRDVTLKIWQDDHRNELVAAQHTWDSITAINPASAGIKQPQRKRLSRCDRASHRG